MCVCVRVCVCAYVCVCARLCAHACKHVRCKYGSMAVCLSVHLFVLRSVSYASMYVYMHTRVYVSMHVGVCLYMPDSKGFPTRDLQTTITFPFLPSSRQLFLGYLGAAQPVMGPTGHATTAEVPRLASEHPANLNT